MGYDTMPDKELKQRARWDLYLLILRAGRDVFHGRARPLLHPRAADGAALSYLEIWPTARSRGFSAIRRGYGNTILAILHQTDDYPDVCRGASFP